VRPGLVSGVPASGEATAAELLAWTLSRPATLGAGRLVCVDGPAGSGKTTLARDITLAAEDSVRLLHMDDIYEGWSGLEAAMTRVADDVVGPLRTGRAGRYRRYDWVREELAEEHLVEPVDLLVIEGVGSGGAAYADATTCLVWVEAPADERLRRGLERDGEAVRAQWLAFMADEEAMFARERTRARADVIVDGTGATPPSVRARG
jgi:uridine kinase